MSDRIEKFLNTEMLDALDAANYIISLEERQKDDAVNHLRAQTTSRGRCVEAGEQFDEFFFPDRESKRSTEEAVSLCGRCAVRSSCLTLAIVNDEQYGVFGGLNSHDRNRLVSLTTEQASEYREKLKANAAYAA